MHQPALSYTRTDKGKLQSDTQYIAKVRGSAADRVVYDELCAYKVGAHFAQVAHAFLREEETINTNIRTE